MGFKQSLEGSKPFEIDGFDLIIWFFTRRREPKGGKTDGRRKLSTGYQGFSQISSSTYLKTKAFPGIIRFSRMLRRTTCSVMGWVLCLCDCKLMTDSKEAFPEGAWQL